MKKVNERWNEYFRLNDKKVENISKTKKIVRLGWIFYNKTKINSFKTKKNITPIKKLIKKIVLIMKKSKRKRNFLWNNKTYILNTKNVRLGCKF